MSKLAMKIKLSVLMLITMISFQNCGSGFGVKTASAMEAKSMMTRLRIQANSASSYALDGCSSTEEDPNFEHEGQAPPVPEQDCTTPVPSNPNTISEQIERLEQILEQVKSYDFSNQPADVQELQADLIVSIQAVIDALKTAQGGLTPNEPNPSELDEEECDHPEEHEGWE